MSVLPPDDDLAALAGVQGVLIEVLEARNSQLEARVAELEERLARLERLLSRYSGNSSMPPSADDLPGRKSPEQREQAGKTRRPGKQPGARGAHLAWRDDPDVTVRLFPAGPCPCGLDLASDTTNILAS